MTPYDIYKNPRVKININKLEKEMILEGKTINQIAKEIEVSNVTIRRRIIEKKGLEHYKDLIKPEYKKKDEEYLKDEMISRKIRERLLSGKLTDEQKSETIFKEKVLRPTRKLITGRYKRNLNVNLRDSYKAMERIYEIYKLNNLGFPSKRAVAAASVYIQSLGDKKKRKNITQKKLSNAFEVSIPTIRKVFERIKIKPIKFYEELFKK